VVGFFTALGELPTAATDELQPAEQGLEPRYEQAGNRGCPAFLLFLECFSPRDQLVPPDSNWLWLSQGSGWFSRASTSTPRSHRLGFTSNTAGSAILMVDGPHA
jgi:hypothetical protein